MEKAIGADWLIYQDLQDLIAAASEGNPEISEFECSVFNGEYVTGDVDEIYLERLKSQRNDLVKQGQKKGVESTKGKQVADMNSELL